MHPTPTTMQAVQIIPASHKGEDGSLHYTSLPIPTPKPYEVLIHVAACGVNRADIFQRQGRYPPPDGASPLPGLEVAGHIAAIGDAVHNWKVGDAVCALLAGGGYAQYATAHAGHVLPIPKGWSMVHAAAIPEAILTVWMALHIKAGLRKAESVLIHGGASGIGMIATQYARQLGARIFTTASTSEKCAISQSWGAECAIPYTEQDFATVVADKTQGTGVDVILDMVGGDYLPRNLQCLAKNGRMVTLAFLRGAKPEHFSVAPILLKNLSWHGATLRSQSNEIKAQWAADIHNQLGEVLDKKIIYPHIDATFPLKDAKKAHKYMEQNLNIGKIVLQV